MSSIRLFLSGLLMGSADLVPGISGGTVAFLLGFYSEFIRSLKELRWKFLLPLGLGMAVAILSFANGIEWCLENAHPRALLYASFFGLIMGSAWACFKRVGLWNKKTLLITITGALGAFLLSAPTQTQGEFAIPIDQLKEHPPHYNLSNIEGQMLTGISRASLGAMLSKGLLAKEDRVTDGKEWFEAGEVALSSTAVLDWRLTLAGAIAICAMLLPGISGSYLLQVFGLYPVVIGALAAIGRGLSQATLPMEPLLQIGSLGFGILIGGILFTRVLYWLFQHHEMLLYSFLTGIIVGAMRAVWPFWSYALIWDPVRPDKGVQLLPQEPLLTLSDPLFTLGACAICLISFSAVIWINWRQSDLSSPSPQE